MSFPRLGHNIEQTKGREVHRALLTAFCLLLPIRFVEPLQLAAEMLTLLEIEGLSLAVSARFVVESLAWVSPLPEPGSPAALETLACLAL